MSKEEEVKKKKHLLIQINKQLEETESKQAYQYKSQQQSIPPQQQEKICNQIEFEEIEFPQTFQLKQNKQLLKINQKLRQKVKKLQDQNFSLKKQLYKIEQKQKQNYTDKYIVNKFQNVLTQNNSLISHYKQRCQNILEKLKQKNVEIVELSCQNVRLKGIIDNLQTQISLNKINKNKTYNAKQLKQYSKLSNNFSNQINNIVNIDGLKKKLDVLRNKRVTLECEGNSLIKHPYQKLNLFNIPAKKFHLRQDDKRVYEKKSFTPLSTKNMNFRQINNERKLFQFRTSPYKSNINNITLSYLNFT